MKGRIPEIAVGWWIGAAAFAGLFAVASLWTVPHVQSDIGERVRAGLTGEGVGTDGLRLDVSGREVTISGVTDPESVGRIRRGARVSGVHRLTVRGDGDRFRSAPDLDPLTVRVTGTGSARRLRLIGSVQSEGQHSALVEAALRYLPEGLDDQLTIAGTPSAEGYLAVDAVALIVTALPARGTIEIHLDDDLLTLTGAVPPPGTHPDFDTAVGRAQVAGLAVDAPS